MILCFYEADYFFHSYLTMNQFNSVTFYDDTH